jgi:DnaJ-class molecular chaperone
MHAHTHYDTLKVARDAPPEVIAAAYKALAKKFHPDVSPGAGAQMRDINAARDALLDAAERERYDAGLRRQEDLARAYPDVFRRARSLALAQGIEERHLRFKKGAFRISRDAASDATAEMVIKFEFRWAG